MLATKTKLIKHIDKISRTHILFNLEHFELQNSITKFIEERINPNVNEWESQHQFPIKTIFRELGQLGVFGLNKPMEFGGQDLDFSYSIASAEAMGKCACGAIPMSVAVQSDMATPALAEFGSDFLRREYLTPSISGERIAAIGVSEASCGSDVSAIKTKARWHKGDLIIDGSKQWITNGHMADWICLLANTESRDTTKITSPHHSKSLICVNMNEPGIQVPKIRQKLLGMHSAGNGAVEIFFDQVRVPATSIIGEVGKGFHYQMAQFQDERLVAVAVLIEPLKRCIELTASYALERPLFGERVFDQQYVKYKLAELSTEIEALRSLLYNVTFNKIMAKNKSEIEKVTIGASMAKFKGGRLARKITDETLQIWGGAGYTWDNPVSRLWRDLRVFSIAAGCDEVMLSIIAKHLKKQYIK